MKENEESMLATDMAVMENSAPPKKERPEMERKESKNFFQDEDNAEYINGKKVHVVRVAGDTPVNALAGSIVAIVEEGSLVDLRACGASSLNQLTKGAIVARGILAKNGIDVLLRPGFSTMKDMETTKTCITMKVILQ